MLLVDTNVFLGAVNERAAEHARCRAWVEHLRSDGATWFTTWGVIYEFLRVSTHPRVFPGPLTPEQAVGLVHGLIEHSGLTPLVHTPRHGEVAAIGLREVPDIRGSAFHDAQIAVLMREHGLRRILTRDTGFHRFPWLEVVDPLRAEPR